MNMKITEMRAIPYKSNCNDSKMAAVLHAVSSTPAINLASDTAYHNWSDDVIESPFAVKDGSIEVPDAPGLGVTVDPEKVEEYRVD
jgi:glucarate dehydratase